VSEEAWHNFPHAHGEFVCPQHAKLTAVPFESVRRWVPAQRIIVCSPPPSVRSRSLAASSDASGLAFVPGFVSSPSGPTNSSIACAGTASANNESRYMARFMASPLVRMSSLSALDQTIPSEDMIGSIPWAVNLLASAPFRRPDRLGSGSLRVPAIPGGDTLPTTELLPPSGVLGRIALVGTPETEW
jgi:hypothetical protein